MDSRLKVLSSEVSILGEGPLWDDEESMLYYTDIEGKKLHVMRLGSGKPGLTYNLPQKAGSMAFKKEGGLLAAMEDGIYNVHVDGSISPAHQPIKIKGFRFNDGKAGPDGAFYAGTCGYKETPGALYRLSPEGELTMIVDNVVTSNGMDWSLDLSRMYYIDSFTHNIDVFDFDPKEGFKGGRRTFIAMGDGNIPDGMCVDAQGNLWVAIWDGWRVMCFDGKTGKELTRIEMPVSRPSCCVFTGGSLSTMVITSALPEEPDECQPLAGQVFSIQPGVKGRECFRYGKDEI